jgi:hypothetical protein
MYTEPDTTVSPTRCRNWSDVYASFSVSEKGTSAHWRCHSSASPPVTDLCGNARCQRLFAQACHAHTAESHSWTVVNSGS